MTFQTISIMTLTVTTMNKIKHWDWNCPDRMTYAWLCLSIDYPYYEGINEDRAIQWKELPRTHKNKIIETYGKSILKNRIKGGE